MSKNIRQRIVRLYLALIAGALVPGGAHIVLGKTLKGLIFAIAILSSFFAGLLLTGNYSFTEQAEFRHPVMFWLQYLVGAPAFISASMKPEMYITEPFKDPKIFEIGVLYAAVAGLLNLLVFINGVTLSLKLENKTIARKPQMTQPVKEPDEHTENIEVHDKLNL